jgi:antibiotic biosynthesis monooxygenase (ABM) superfamily enzyme
MYGTVARLRLLPGKEQDFLNLFTTFEEESPGYVGQYIYRLDSGGGEYMISVVFPDKDAYVANANSPEMAVLYEQYRSLLSEDPEWHDGEVIHAYSA